MTWRGQDGMPIGRPRMYDSTPCTARAAPSLSTKPWRDDDKQALAYLRSSDAGAISVLVDIDGASIHVGYDPADVEIAETFWLPAAKALSIAARARHIAGHDADVDGAVAAIRRAAAESRTTITLHDVAIGRAREMAAQLDLMVEEMQANGALKSFNREFKARRAAASAQGRGFMSYGAAIGALAQDAGRVARIIGRQCAATCSIAPILAHVRVLRAATDETGVISPAARVPSRAQANRAVRLSRSSRPNCGASSARSK
jgi:hypothetical protein